MSDNLLILGRNSYIGNNFTRYAEARRNSAAPNRDTHIVSLSSQECDLLDRDSVRRCFSSLARVPFTLVFFAVINKSAANSYQALLDNLAMVQNVLTGVKDLSLSSIVYISSVDVYGIAPELPITERSRIAPDTWYGLAKYNCEWMIRTSGEVTVPVTVLRVPGVFGSSLNDRSIIGSFVAKVRKGEPLILNAGGNVMRDYVWVDDISRLLTELIPLRYRGVVNGVSGASHSLREVVEHLGTALGIPIQSTINEQRTSRDFDLRFDTTLLRNLLPQFRFTDLIEAMRSYR